MFISSDQYPEGGASPNRHIGIGKGLVEAGHKVFFVLLSKQNTTESEFVFEKISFSTIFRKDTLYGEGGKLKKAFVYLSLIIKGCRAVQKVHSKNKIDAIVLLDTDVWTLIPFLCLAKRKRIRVVHERTEYPFMFIGKRLNDRLNYKIYLSFFLPRLDGIYVITNTLKDYFSQMVKNKVPVRIINMIVDPARFDLSDNTSLSEGKYLAYCGDLNHQKDGVDILVKAFFRVLENAKIPPETRLLLIGDFSDAGFRSELMKLISANKYAGNVVITGKTDRARVPVLLSKAAALVLARPQSKQSEGGFPTKLGEYLSTGKPVIVTDVGEICNFLKDGINAFVAIPGDVNSFYDKISEVFNDYQNALRIAANGRKLVDNEFNYFKQAVILARFIGSL